jgi:proteasome beta subunit
MTTSEGADLAIRGLNASMRRDAASGNGMDIVIITKRGYKQLTKKDIEDRKKKMGIE